MFRLDVDVVGVVSVVEESMLILYQFLCGVSSGMFLYSLFEDLDFIQSVDLNWVWEKLEFGGFESQWESVLIEWIMVVFQVFFNEIGVSLS